MKGEVRVAKRASFGKIVRKRLSDITNTSQGANRMPSEEPKPLLFPSGSEITKDYVDKLIQVSSYLCPDNFVGSIISGYFDIPPFSPCSASINQENRTLVILIEERKYPFE